MNESNLRAILKECLQPHGYWPVTQRDASICTKCKTRNYPKIGRPDQLVLHPTGRSCVIELKVLHRNETSFKFEQIRPEQRRWLDAYTGACGAAYLGLGVIRPYGTKSTMKRFYIVPWPNWLVAETEIQPHQDSIPLYAGKGYKKALQEQQLDIVTLFANYEIGHNSCWYLPASHPLGVNNENIA